MLTTIVLMTIFCSKCAAMHMENLSRFQPPRCRRLASCADVWLSFSEPSTKCGRFTDLALFSRRAGLTSFGEPVLIVT